ncbi:MAG: hypothetical protein JXR42_04645 [Gammaproteobacteria bacterium]|nr:hypothetical protein [Gammaproteobacteria bacterium]
MAYIQNQNRRSNRFKGYNYATAGTYYITICVQHHQHLFGKIIRNEMQLNSAGKMVNKWWHKIPAKYKSAQLGAFIIMPNHLHAIIHLAPVGAAPCGRPDISAHGTAKHNQAEQEKCYLDLLSKDHATPSTGGHTGPPLRENYIALGDVVRWFKTMSTNEYIKHVKNGNWCSFHKRLWQRDYYETIINNKRQLTNIRQYILDNPRRWQNYQK